MVKYRSFDDMPEDVRLTVLRVVKELNERIYRGTGAGWTSEVTVDGMSFVVSPFPLDHIDSVVDVQLIRRWDTDELAEHLAGISRIDVEWRFDAGTIMPDNVVRICVDVLP